MKLVVAKANKEEAKACLHRAVRDVGQVNTEIETCHDQIESRTNGLSEQVRADEPQQNQRQMDPRRSTASTGQGAGRGRGNGRGRGRGRGGPGRGRGRGRIGGRSGPGRGRGMPTHGTPRSPNRLPKRVDQRDMFQARHSPEGKRNRLSAVNLSLAPDEFKPGSNVQKWTKSEWKFQEYKTKGGWSKTTEGLVEKCSHKSIRRGIEKFKKHPQLFVAMMYPTEMLSWPEDEQEYTLIYRAGTTGLQPKGISPKGSVTFLMHVYQPLPSFPNDILPLKFRDDYTDAMTYHGVKLISKKLPAYLPGRGTGLLDDPRLKVIGDIDPSDIAQGSVGDCWLLSGIASLAEFDGAVERLFRKTKDLDLMPFSDGRPNQYTITLWDLPTWKEVDVVVDERLAARKDIKGALFGAKTSEDGELWVCYLEKAIAAHCGGWDKIDGGQCTHAWSLLTGCKEQYIIQKVPENPDEGTFGIWAKYDPTAQCWAQHGNAPSEGQQGVWRVPWPQIGGGGSEDLDQDSLFLRLCAWNDENFLIGTSSKGDSDRNDTNGVIDNHAYSVIDCRSNVAETGFDLIQVRNPWGYGGIENGLFARNGKGWSQYPEILEALEYKDHEQDDGIFWVTKEEFFNHYQAIYLGAINMKKFLGIPEEVKEHASKKAAPPAEAFMGMARGHTLEDFRSNKDSEQLVEKEQISSLPVLVPLFVPVAETLTQTESTDNRGTEEEKRRIPEDIDNEYGDDSEGSQRESSKEIANRSGDESSPVSIKESSAEDADHSDASVEQSSGTMVDDNDEEAETSGLDSENDNEDESELQGEEDKEESTTEVSETVSLVSVDSDKARRIEAQDKSEQLSDNEDNDSDTHNRDGYDDDHADSSDDQGDDDDDDHSSDERSGDNSTDED